MLKSYSEHNILAVRDNNAQWTSSYITLRLTSFNIPVETDNPTLIKAKPLFRLNASYHDHEIKNDKNVWKWFTCRLIMQGAKFVY